VLSRVGQASEEATIILAEPAGENVILRDSMNPDYRRKEKIITSSCHPAERKISLYLFSFLPTTQLPNSPFLLKGEPSIYFL
jgi:hypothetical protein